ncbi:MAG: VOC family protein [Balneolaceae bacterium]|nr:MAG: VOC family protein [Balneolaceae bacterium]
MKEIITGIQQVGIGVDDIDSAWKWYRTWFGTDVPVFDDEADAALMKQYTGGIVHSRRAVLALNMSGGGGFEIWQFTSRKPESTAFKTEYGDLGINAVKMKCRDVKTAYDSFKSRNCENLSPLFTLPDQSLTFQVTDPGGNRFQMVHGDSWFGNTGTPTGGVCGVVIGVSDIERVLPVYREALGFTEIIYDVSGSFDDLDPGCTFRRTLLRKNESGAGAFSRLFGHIDIELIESRDRSPRSIYEGRFWGDPGFIHVCFDVIDMDELKERLQKLGFPFTVDSASTFDMGEASGRFSYIEDPDRTLIEFVQAHKVPVMKRWGWYINLRKRSHQKPLQNWMLRCMSFARVKD